MPPRAPAMSQLSAGETQAVAAASEAAGPAQRSLFERDGNGIFLIGAKCGACGAVSFPLIAYGCPACGAAPSVLERHRLCGRGTVECAVTVHVSLSPALCPPRVIGRVRLEEGPEVEAALEFPIGHSAAFGSPVQIILAAASDASGSDPRLAFAPVLG